jgi:hypothetical protein
MQVARPPAAPGFGTADSNALVQGCAGGGEHPIGRAALHDMAEIHDEDAVTQKPHDIEVVADEQV